MSGYSEMQSLYADVSFCWIPYHPTSNAASFQTLLAGWGGGSGGINQEFGINIHTLPTRTYCIAQGILLNIL